MDLWKGERLDWKRYLRSNTDEELEIGLNVTERIIECLDTADINLDLK